MDDDFVRLTVTSVFLACLVEMIEALTIVLAIGTARRWSSALQGAVAALIALGAFVAIFGSALIRIPQQWLWLIMGSLLLFFGVQWLRNALLRYSGIKALHNESAVFKDVTKEAKKKHKFSGNVDWYAFTIVFKGVFLEGLEVVFIVLLFSSSSKNNIHDGILAALVALIIVSILGVIIHKPLVRVPENTMKFIVGLILTTFGTYFCSEGVGIYWTHGEVTFFAILLFYLFICLGAMLVMQKLARRAIHD